MTPTESFGPQLDKLQRQALIVGVVGLGVSLIGLMKDPVHFWQSYLFGYVFWSGLTLGSLGIFFLHNVVGRNWGVAIRRFVEAGLKNLLVVAVLAVPLFFALKTLYA